MPQFQVLDIDEAEDDEAFVAGICRAAFLVSDDQGKPCFIIHDMRNSEFEADVRDLRNLSDMLKDL